VQCLIILNLPLSQLISSPGVENLNFKSLSMMNRGDLKGINSTFIALFAKVERP